jgi:hypothetical protein
MQLAEYRTWIAAETGPGSNKAINYAMLQTLLLKPSVSKFVRKRLGSQKVRFRFRHLHGEIPSTHCHFGRSTLTAASPTFSAGCDCQNRQPHRNALDRHRACAANLPPPITTARHDMASLRTFRFEQHPDDTFTKD